MVGIPGHGCLNLVESLRKSVKLKLLEVKHEQSAVHLADGYYRASGVPMAVYTSIGPGAINTAVGIATSFADSIPVMVFTAEAHTYMYGSGVLQEIERSKCANSSAVLEPLVKRSWVVVDPALLVNILPRAYTKMMEGRRGPVHIVLPMNISATEVNRHCWNYQLPSSRLVPPSSEIARMLELLISAKKPVLLLGGGVRSSNAYREVFNFAERMQIPVITTMMGKSSFPEHHPLNFYHCGVKGTACGNKLTSTADVIAAIGCRLTDKTCSSFKEGVTFNIPSTKLIQIDIDSCEIGKNYEVEVGLIGDIKATLQNALDELENYHLPNRKEYLNEIMIIKSDWLKQLDLLREAHLKSNLPTISLYLKEFQALDIDCSIVTSSGNSQAQVFQELSFAKTDTYFSAGGFSTMGYTIPAALGIQIARPEQTVFGILGDGDFLMTIQELATAAQYNLPVIYLVFNNCGWQAIKDLQLDKFGQESVIATEFKTSFGDLYSPDFSVIAEAFGCKGFKINRLDEMKHVVRKAMNTGKPCVIEIPVTTKYPYSGGLTTGWWDLPIVEKE